jgi:hypothetical protein
MSREIVSPPAGRPRGRYWARHRHQHRQGDAQQTALDAHGRARSPACNRTLVNSNSGTGGGHAVGHGRVGVFGQERPGAQCGLRGTCAGNFRRMGRRRSFHSYSGGEAPRLQARTFLRGRRKVGATAGRAEQDESRTCWRRASGPALPSIWLIRRRLTARR